METSFAKYNNNNWFINLKDAEFNYMKHGLIGDRYRMSLYSNKCIKA